MIGEKPYNHFVDTAVFTVFSLTVLFAMGCDSRVNLETPEPSMGSSANTSVQQLKQALPNIAMLDIKSSKYEVFRNSSFSFIPSPSDQQDAIRGIFSLPEEQVAYIESKYGWRFVSREELPEFFIATIPEGDCFMSDEMNVSFNDNSYFAHGLIVRIGGEESVFYFLASDIDHPIKFRR